MIPVAAGHFPAAPGGRPAFWAATGRSGGISAPPFESLNLASHVGDEETSVMVNRERVAQFAGLDASDLTVLQAEHGGRVQVIDRPGVLDTGDGAVTTQVGIGLVALGADCVPIALSATAGVPVVGVAHCGWMGLGADIVAATVGAMRECGGEAIHAVLGPSICAHCYRVAHERLEALQQTVSKDVFLAATAVEGTIGVADGVAAQLEALGVQTLRVPGCTAEDASLFSHRRDGLTGRQGMIVRL